MKPNYDNEEVAAREKTVSVSIYKTAARGPSPLACLREQRGFTLIEVMIVIVILAVLTAGSLSLVTFIFDSNIRSGQILNQQATVQESFGFMTARLAKVSPPIGTLNSTGAKINPLSIAGDQVMFRSNGLCVRVWYAKWAEQIRAKTSASCTSAAIALVRGPNQTPIRGGNKAQPGDSDYDVALDTDPGPGANAPFVIAGGVIPTRPSNANTNVYPNASLRVFNYQDLSQVAIDENSSNGINPQAKSDSVSTWYNTIGNRDNIGNMIVTEYVVPVTPAGVSSRVAAQAYQRTVFFPL